MTDQRRSARLNSATLTDRLTEPASRHQYTQSAYRKFHSTETPLVKIHNDLITTVDVVDVDVVVEDVGALALLDLSAAFDTVDHQLLLGFFVIVSASPTQLSPVCLISVRPIPSRPHQ